MKKLSAICFFIIAVSISAIAQERQDVPPFDTLYNEDSTVMNSFRYGPYKLGDTTFFYEGCWHDGKYTEKCRVYIDRDSTSAKFKRMMGWALDSRRRKYDIEYLVRKIKARGLDFPCPDMGDLKGVFLPLRSLNGEVVTSDYQLFTAYISDSVVVWHEFDFWPYAIQKVNHVSPDVTIAEAISDRGDHVQFWINMVDAERRVIRIHSTSDSYVPEGYYVHSSRAGSFPLLVWDTDHVPDEVNLQFGTLTDDDFR